jgi:hypothetical protein
MRSKGSAAELEQRRLAVQRVHDGWLHKDVAAFLGVSERAVGRWVAAHRAHGDDGLQAKPAPGGKPRLSDDQALQVLAWRQVVGGFLSIGKSWLRPRPQPRLTCLRSETGESLAGARPGESRLPESLVSFFCK